MIKKILFTFMMVLSGAAFAADSPEDLVKNISSEVLSVVKNDAAYRSGDTKQGAKLINEKVIPHFDMPRMTALAVGREWKKASAEQRDKLTQEFKTLIVRTYANAFASYKDQNIRFLASRSSEPDDVTVRSEIVQPGQKAIPVEYSMARIGDSWKVYDITIAGISLVSNYRDQFGSEIKNNGIDGLIVALNQKNKV